MKNEDSAAYCVFDTNTGKAYESYCSLSEAERRAEEKNNLLKERGILMENIITDQEKKYFYSAAGIVLNYIQKHNHKFSKSSNYRNATNSSMAHQGSKLKDYIIRQTQQWLFKNINDHSKDVDLFKMAMLNLIEYGSFDIEVSEYTAKYADIYLLSCMGKSFPINKNII